MMVFMWRRIGRGLILLFGTAFFLSVSFASSQGAPARAPSPLETPMPPELEPIPPFERTSPHVQNSKARKRIQNSVKRMRDVIRAHRKMRGLKDPFLPR